MAVTLDIDGSVQKINAKLQTTREALVGVANGYEQIGEASKEAVGGASKDQEKLASSTKQGSKALDDQRGIIEKMEAHLKRLEKGQKKATNVKDVKKYNTEIAKTRASLNSLKGAGVSSIGAVNGAAVASQGVFRSLRATLATTFAPLFAAGAAVAGIQQIISTVSEYEQTAADLQAITGANGDTLEFLKQSAVEVGLSTTISAGQTLEAYKLIASAKPELLSNAEGLAEITREAVALTEAMGGDLPTAATNLTDIMNQFNAPASEASRFVNALAAGSKEGSADVGQLAASILVAGTEAKSSNVAFEESVGLLEVLAEKGKKGAEAGTGLRNILSKLSATDILPKDATARLEAAGVDIATLSDKSLTFTDRLRALAPVQNDANALTAVFGLENKAVAQILLQNVDRADELTEAVTGTSVAYEQANIRTATAAGEYTKLKNTISALVTEAGAGLSGFLATSIRLFREGLLVVASFISVIASLPSFIRDNSVAFKSLAAAVVVWNTQLILASANSLRLAAIEKGRAAITTAVTVAQNLLNAAMTANPIGLVIKGVALLIAGFGILYNKSQTVRAGIAGLGAVAKEIFKIIVESFQSFKDGFEAIKKGDFSGAFDSFKDGLVKSNPVGIALTEGKRLAGAFNKGFKDKVDLEIDQQKAKDLLAQADNLTVSTSANNTNNPITPNSPVAPAATPFIDPAKAKAEADKRAKEEAQRQKDIIRTRLAAMADGQAKELALEEQRFTDLVAKLEEYGLDSTEAVYQNELNKFQIKSKFLNDAADLEGLSGEERINYLYKQTQAELAAIESALKDANGGEVVGEQAAQLNLLRKKASEDYLKQLEELQSKEAQQAQQHEINLLELRSGDFDTIKAFEEFKQAEILKIRLKGAEAQLALLEKVKGAEDDSVLALKGTINSIKGEIEGLAKAGNTAKEFNLFRLIGLDPDDPANGEIIKGIETAAATTAEVLTQINDIRLDTAQQEIDRRDEEIEKIEESIEAKQGELEEEQALADEGFANNALGVQQEIALLQQQQAAEKAEREKALNEKKKIQKQQAIIDTITQGSSLITAAAQVFQSVAAIPFVGVPIAIGLVATMLGSFVAAKAKVFQNIKAQKAEKGLFKVLRGNRHSAGGIDVGHGIEAEDGEAMGILSRSATRTFGSAYEAFTNAANKGDRKGMAKVAAILGGGFKIDRGAAGNLEGKEAKIVQLKTEVNATLQSKELKENNRLLRAMLKNQTSTNSSVEYTGDRKIIRTGNSTRVIKNRRKHG